MGTTWLRSFANPLGTFNGRKADGLGRRDITYANDALHPIWHRDELSLRLSGIHDAIAEDNPNFGFHL
jgi:hypothetical protein